MTAEEVKKSLENCSNKYCKGCVWKGIDVPLDPYGEICGFFEKR